MSETTTNADIPAHVSPELVRPFPYVLGHTTTRHPHSFIAAIHEGPEIFYARNAYNGVISAWVPRRFKDIQEVYLDNEHFSVRSLSAFPEMIGADWLMVPAQIDPPQHMLYRALVNPLFTPKKMAALEDRIRGYARSQALALRERGSCEFMRDFAFEFPIKVFLELMGLPQEQTAQFLAWEHKLLHEPDHGEMMRATHEIVDYLQAEMRERQRAPRDDFMSFGILAEVDGRKLDEGELTGFYFNLFIGGLDTVSTNMGMQFRHLAEHPDDQETLRAHPEMVPDAIDELMRAYAAVATARVCVKERQLGDITVRPGDKVLAATFLAGRDPDAFDRPNEVILTRKPKHLSFGYGVHLCVGMHLARREMRIAMEEFLGVIPSFQVAPGAEITSYLAAMIQPVALPLVWRP